MASTVGNKRANFVESNDASPSDAWRNMSRSRSKESEVRLVVSTRSSDISVRESIDLVFFSVFGRVNCFEDPTPDAPMGSMFVVVDMNLLVSLLRIPLLLLLLLLSCFIFLFLPTLKLLLLSLLRKCPLNKHRIFLDTPQIARRLLRVAEKTSSPSSRFAKLLIISCLCNLQTRDKYVSATTFCSLALFDSLELLNYFLNWCYSQLLRYILASSDLGLGTSSVPGFTFPSSSSNFPVEESRGLSRNVRSSPFTLAGNTSIDSLSGQKLLTLLLHSLFLSLSLSLSPLIILTLFLEYTHRHTHFCPLYYIHKRYVITIL